MNTGTTTKTGLMWFRRDLRLADNAALHQALRQCGQIYAVFVFDPDILHTLPRADRRVEFMRDCLVELDQAIQSDARHPVAGLITLHRRAQEAIPQLAQELAVDVVFANHDDEPSSLARDRAVADLLQGCGIRFQTCKDHVVFERQELLTVSGQPYRVFTPYKNAWLKAVARSQLSPWSTTPAGHQWAARPVQWCKPIPSLMDLGFLPTNLAQLQYRPGASGAQVHLTDFCKRIDNYHQTRDFPALKGPSGL